MNDKLLLRLLACVCLTSLATAAAMGFASTAGLAVDAVAKPFAATPSPRAHVDGLPYPAPQIDLASPDPEPAPTF